MTSGAIGSVDISVFGRRPLRFARGNASPGGARLVHEADAIATAPDASSFVRIEGVTKTYAGSVTALADVSLAVGAGEFFTLLGPSGCGKTTLLRLLAGFETPEAGAVSIGGRPILEDPPNRRPVNIVFQSYALFPHMSVARNVAFGLERQGLAGDAVAARVDAVLRLVRLETMAERRPSALSGGQQQRVALARALAPRPKLLLLDEPLSALDVQLRRGMQVELKRIQRESGITFLLVTHDQEEALSLSDRIAVMDAGHVRQVGSPTEIYARPTCRFVASFMGANVLPGARVGLDASFAAIRPEQVEVTRDASAGLAGRVAELAFRGASSLCLVALDGGETLTAVRHDLPDGLALGDNVCCRLPPAALVPLAR